MFNPTLKSFSGFLCAGNLNYFNALAAAIAAVVAAIVVVSALPAVLPIWRA